MSEQRERWLAYARTLTTAYRYRALADPQRTLLLRPEEITRKCRLHVDTRATRGSKWYDFGLVRAGDWDLQTRPRNVPLEETPTHLSVFHRYVQGRPWPETPIFAAKLAVIATEGEIDGCRTREELLVRYQRLDQVYEELRSDGWRLEEEVGGRFEDNLAVSITRTGGFLLANGGEHRIAIARLLRLSVVRAYVLARHESWQAVRERMAAGLLSYRHPDTQDLHRARRVDTPVHTPIGSAVSAIRPGECTGPPLLP